MKKIVLLLLLLLPIILKAQDTLKYSQIPFDRETNEYSYTDIVDVPGVPKNDLYSRLHEWVALNFKSANSVIQMDDKEAGKIIGKGNATSFYTYRIIFKNTVEYRWNFTFNFTVKDGKYRLIMNDFTTTNTTTENSSYLNYGSAATMMDAVKKYNKKKRRDDDDEMGVSDIRAKSSAQQLTQLNDLVLKTFAEVKAAVSKKSKDDF